VAVDSIFSSTDILFSIFLVSLLPDDSMNLDLEEQVFIEIALESLIRFKARGAQQILLSIEEFCQWQNRTIQYPSLWCFMFRTQI